MKKRLFGIFICSILILGITGCSSPTDYTEIPKGYIDKEEHFDRDGFRDYTDYAKYIYDSPKIIVDSNEYKNINNENIENIKEYFENFRNWMETCNRIDEFDFDDNLINEGDYIRLKTKEGEKIGDSKYGKYENYTIYFFDIETLTLYYMHENS